MPHIGNFPIPGYPKPLAVGPATFASGSDAYDFSLNEKFLKNRVALSIQRFYAPVILPSGVTVKRLTLFGYRDDDAATLMLELLRADATGITTIMASVVATWTTGDSSGYDDTITEPVVDNGNYSYCLRLSLTPNDSVEDVYLRRAQVDWS